jgi:branched-chain amino acid transport system permease protein
MIRHRLNPSTLSSLIILSLLGLWPFFVTNGAIYFRVFAMAFLYSALAFSWNLYALTGSISLGHAAFFGLGAYGSALANHYWALSPCVTIPLGGILGAAYGILWSAVFKKLRGPYFALATLASVEIPKVLIDNWESFTYGSLGLVGIASLPSFQVGDMVFDFGENLRSQYYLLFSSMLLIGWIHHKAIVSRWGWAIRAIREDEIAASSLGVNVFGVRFQALVVSAFFTGLCGAVYAHLIGLIEPPLVFNLHISALPLVLSIFGGRYQPYGPFLGALILYPLDQLLFHSWLPAGHAVVYGMVIVITILCFPQGIAAWLQRKIKFA